MSADVAVAALATGANPVYLTPDGVDMSRLVRLHRLYHGTRTIIHIRALREPTGPANPEAGQHGSHVRARMARGRRRGSARAAWAGVPIAARAARPRTAAAGAGAARPDRGDYADARMAAPGLAT